jgi:hypothetical protein
VRDCIGNDQARDIAQQAVALILQEELTNVEKERDIRLQVRHLGDARLV